MKKIFLTGGCGFIGSHLVDALVNRGYHLTVLDDLSAKTSTKYLQKHIDNNNVSFFRYDIKDMKKLFSLKEEYEYIFHLAAQPDVQISVKKPQIDFENNIIGTFNILEFARKRDIKKIIFASSAGTVYGEPEIHPTPENHPLRPISNYGAAKAAAEMYCSSYASLYNIDITALRLGNIFGPRSTHGVMFDFYHKLKKDSTKLNILGDGKQTKTYLYISDTVEAFLVISNKMRRGFDIYNVSSDDVISVYEIADQITESMKLKDVTYCFTGGKKGWKGDVVFTSADITKVKSIGWKPKINIKKGINLYIQWLKDQD